MFRPFQLVTASLVGVAFGLASPWAAAFAAGPDVAVEFVESCPPGAIVGVPVSAVGLRATSLPDAPMVNVVLLVDTSASQSGPHRDRSLAAASRLLEEARAADRFSLAAVDVQFAPLVDGFHPAGSPAIAAGRLAIDRRVPLGSTDLATAVIEAANRLRETEGGRAIVYIGDGPGLGGIEDAQFAAVVARLRSDRISMSSLGIGARVNWSCLAALANATGGAVLVPAANADAAAAGAEIGKRAIQPVLWTEGGAVACKEPQPILGMLPGRLPPLREDRDTVVIVVGEPAGCRLQFAAAAGSAAPAKFDLAIPKSRPDSDHAYLAELAQNAVASDGLFLPLAGREWLAAARDFIRGEARALATLAGQAESTGTHDAAVRLALASLRRDPDNQQAAVILAAAKRQAAPDEAAGLPAPVERRGDAPPAVADAPLAAGDGTELAELDALRSVRGQQLEREVTIAIRDARHMLTTDPDGARTKLKEVQLLVSESTDLEPGTRARLLSLLEMRVRESIVRSREKTERDLASQRKRAIGEERLRLTAELQRREEKIKQLMGRYNALVEQGIAEGYSQSERYPQFLHGEEASGYVSPTTKLAEAERIVGEEITREAPELWANHPIPMTAREVGRTAQLVARILDYDAENYRTRRDQERGFMDELHLVDVAAIPYPDDPPIIYPNARRWREINALRRQYKPAAYDPKSDVEKRIYDALDQKTGPGFKFTENSLNDFATAIRDQFGIPVVFDEKSMEAFDRNAPDITADLPGISLRSALRQVLGNVDLAYVVKDEVLKITTTDGANADLIVKAYPVGDLVLPVDPINPPNPFNLGGTNTQNQNNPINPAAGVAAGGGGVLCWVAREVYGVHDPRWVVFRDWLTTEAPPWLHDTYASHGASFAAWIADRPLAKAVVRGLMDTVVTERLAAIPTGGHFQVAGARSRLAGAVPTDVAAATAPDAATPDAPRPARHPGPDGEERIGLPDSVLRAKDLQAAIAEYLPRSAAIASPQDARDAAARLAQVRVSAAELGRSGDFARAADLIGAAIATGHAEPWMYESLALAMEAAGRSPEEIERVLLSSADFADDATDLLGLAHYLARFGSGDKAIRVCRQITSLDPMNREAYALAMTLAARNDDVAALLWSCPGVLAHEWPAKDRHIAQRAARQAKATIEKLTAEGRKEEAAAFRAAVDAALVRDLVMEFTWAGDADVDVLVEEPPGTVCSRAAPRSTSGGTLLGDEDEPQDSESGLHCERYVAARGFPGHYRVLVRRAWGKVAADTITCEMTLNKGTDHEQRLKRQLPVTADAQYLAVGVPYGRRRERLLDAQVHQDVVVQRTVGKMLLSQQLAAISDSAAAGSLSRSRQEGAEAAAGAPFFRGDAAVGYQPVITTLPEGLNHTARVVVSADRRYVRVTCSPLFSGIGQVTQFNFSGGGAQGTGGMGMGGQGMGGQGMGGMGMGGMGAQGMGGMGMGAMGGGMGMGGMGAQGGGFGAQGGGFGAQGICWVAREVYGEHDPRWRRFRAWLTTEGPAWLLDAYRTHGEDFAAWLRDRPLAKSGVRLLMDRAIAE